MDTLRNIFEANKELFEGLYIYDKYDWSDRYPVIKFSFGSVRSSEQLINDILDVLKRNAEKLGLNVVETEDYGVLFRDIIQKAYQKFKKPVVILIDEYNKPILDNIDQLNVVKQNREILKRLYTEIKNNDEFIMFAFLTGASKFSKTSIFSGLNNIEDITLLPQFGNICGYTHEEANKGRVLTFDITL